MDTTVAALVSVPAILALVNLAKAVGVPAKAAPMVAIAVGVGGAIATQALGSNEMFTAGVNGLMLALAASGFYDVAKQVGPRKEEHVVSVEE